MVAIFPLWRGFRTLLLCLLEECKSQQTSNSCQVDVADDSRTSDCHESNHRWWFSCAVFIVVCPWPFGFCRFWKTYGTSTLDGLFLSSTSAMNTGKTRFSELEGETKTRVSTSTCSCFSHAYNASDDCDHQMDGWHQTRASNSRQVSVFFTQEIAVLFCRLTRKLTTPSTRRPIHN